MSHEEYNKAQKQGMKAYKTSIAEGLYPYLPVLDELLPHAELSHEEHLGILEIPLHHVVGTSTFGRTQAFASNFMPLLADGTEFAVKWANLCTSQMEEGIHDAIKVYEYLNKYYVIEGNKRVSVLKYFHAPTILADVTRKVPKYSEDPEIRLYYEYMDFFSLTRINYLTFNKPGSYLRLLTLLGKDAQTKWTVDEQLDFRHFHAEFRKAFLTNGGGRLPNVTSGDALLLYLSLYPYKDSVKDTDMIFRKKLEKIWPEIVLLGEADSVELMMNPTEERNLVTSVFNKIMPSKAREIAFLYDKEPAASDWIYGHELGRLHLLDVFGSSLDIQSFIMDPEDAATEEKLEQLCRQGFDIIFAVTPKFMKSCLKTAVNHPEVAFLNCSLNSAYNTVRTYYTRMYEAKFLTGMIAGSLSTNNKVGYIADYPLYGAAASINAFALGARMVNPYAKVYLAWSSLKDFDPDAYFRENQVSYISAQDMITPQNNIRRFGLYEETSYGKKNLAMSIYNWGVFYEKLINSIQRGSYKAEESPENKAINYWWGLSAGVIDVICSQHLPDSTLKLVELMKNTISSGLFHPFTGPVADQNGVIRLAKDEIVQPETLMTMDWLAENVTGKIPTLEELKEEARTVVLLRGLDSATGEKGGTVLL